VGHPDFGRAVPCQCTLREFQEGRLARLQRYSNLGPMTRLTFDNLVFSGRNADPANQDLFNAAVAQSQTFAKEPKGWLVLHGPSGSGKTHLAAAIGNRCLADGHVVFFVVVPDLLDHLRATFAPSSEVTYDELFETVRNVPLLIMDDLGAHSATPWAQEKLYQIVNHRYNEELPTVITTSLNLEEMDERLRTRLMSPLSQVVVLERGTPALSRMGGLDLELLRRMTFENFEWKGLQLEPDQRHSLEQAFHNARSFAESPEGWLVLLGSNGCGKTHLAAAIANYRQRQGKPFFFAVVPDILDHFRSTFHPESKINYDDLFETVRTAPLLILDDLGAQSTTPWAQEKLYQIVNYRYNARLPTVITTNRSLEEIEGRLASRMGDVRLSVVIGITAPDYRVDRRPEPRPVPPATRRRR